MTKGDDITSDNFEEIIMDLTLEEADSGGFLKHDDVKHFLRAWFS